MLLVYYLLTKLLNICLIQHAVDLKIENVLYSVIVKSTSNPELKLLIGILCKKIIAKYSIISKLKREKF